MNEKSLSKFLKVNLSQICDNLNINNIIKIEGVTNLNTKEIENLNVKIINRKTGEVNSLTINNDESLELRIKLRNIVIDAINHKYIEKDSVVIFIFDKSVSVDYALGILVLEVSKVLYRIARFKLTEFMEHELVLEKVLEISEEIKKEGREGKKIGTLFIIGEENELAPYLKPLILNPFYGYPDNLKDIINNDLNETIKEYAQLDGAFIISNKGIVISAGTYIDVETSDVKKYYGWGTKHLTASAITQKTKSIAVLVSESGNVIKLFKNGKLILKY